MTDEYPDDVLLSSPEVPEIPPGAHRAKPLDWASPDPVHPLDAAFEQAARVWPDLSGEYNVMEILAAVRLADAWLDAAAPGIYRDNPLANRYRRIAAGPASEGQEAVDALNLATGGNPRKGVVGDELTILDELGDGAVANLLAIQSVTKDTDATWSVFIAALAKIVSRIPHERPEPEDGRQS